MALTPKKLLTLKLLRRYFYARTAHFKHAFIHAGLLAKDPDSAVTRGVLRQLEQEQLIHRYQPKMVDPRSGGVAPMFVLTLKGSAVLAQELNDCGQLLRYEPNFKDWMSLNHYCALTSLHQTTDEAFENQTWVKLLTLLFEHEVISDAEEPSKKFRLHTVVSVGADGHRIVNVPDSMMETEIKGQRRAWYVEYEMGSDNPARIAAKKTKGYAGLAEKQLWKKHAPEARDFRVLCVCPYASFRDNLLKELKGKPGSELWLCCDVKDIRPETFLHSPILHTVEKGMFPLVPAPSGASSLVSRGG